MMFDKEQLLCAQLIPEVNVYQLQLLNMSLSSQCREAISSLIKSPSESMSKQVHPSKSKAVNTLVPLRGERVQGSWWQCHLPRSPISALTITFRAGKSAENYIKLYRLKWAIIQALGPCWMRQCPLRTASHKSSQLMHVENPSGPGE